MRTPDVEIRNRQLYGESCFVDTWTMTIATDSMSSMK